jgi:hypothetical protein
LILELWTDTPACRAQKFMINAEWESQWASA